MPNTYENKTYTAENLKGQRFEFWYDRSLKSWTLTERDAGGNQIGDASYYHNRDRLYTMLRMCGVSMIRDSLTQNTLTITMY